MAFESTFETVSGAFLDELDATLETVAAYIPEELEQVLTNASAYIPSSIDFGQMLKFLGIFAAISLLVSLLGRILLGKRSSLNHSVSSAIGILFIYAVTIIVYTFQPAGLQKFLSPLPFVSFVQDYMVVFPIQDAGFPMLCHEVLSLVILAFLVNLIDTFIPQGQYALSWYLLRFVSVILSMALHFGARWLFDTYLPDVLALYAPVILLGILVAMLLLGVLNAVLSLLLTVVNPIIGGIYTFFFSNIIGKQLTKAVFTTMILCAIVYLLGSLDYTLINISMESLTAYIPMAAIMLALWYITGHVL